MSRRTVVILHPGGLGDLLLAVPAIRGVRARFSSHELLICAAAPGAEFLEDCGLVDRWISADSAGCAALFAGSAPEHPVLTDWLSRCDLAVAWTSDAGGRLAAALKASGAGAAVIQSPFAPTLAGVHQSDRFVEIVTEHAAPVTVTPLAVSSRLRKEAEARLAESGLSGRRALAVVHPGSGSPHKCVPPATLVPVLDGLTAQGLEPVLVEGPADHEMVERLLRALTRPAVVLRHLTVGLLAGVLAQAQVFLGHDSGVTHLAALVGTPTVALFGPTEPARWAPRGPAVTVISERPCSCRSWELVRQCAEKPCLQVSPETIVAACCAARAAAITPRIR